MRPACRLLITTELSGSGTYVTTISQYPYATTVMLSLLARFAMRPSNEDGHDSVEVVFIF